MNSIPPPVNCPNIRCRAPEFNGSHCGLCGARAYENPTSGETFYMVRGQVIAAPADMRKQAAKHSGAYAILGPDPMTATGEPAELPSERD